MGGGREGGGEGARERERAREQQLPTTNIHKNLRFWYNENQHKINLHILKLSQHGLNIIE
jgi:hypothetical protein